MRWRSQPLSGSQSKAEQSSGRTEDYFFTKMTMRAVSKSSSECWQSVRGITALLCGLSIASCALTGCKSVSKCVSPRVEGRVIDANSHQPIKDVVVKRLSANEDYNIKDPSKGGEIMERAQGVHTSEAGEFVLESVRDIAV